jgi:hypothetical protein
MHTYIRADAVAVVTFAEITGSPSLGRNINTFER